MAVVFSGNVDLTEQDKVGMLKSFQGLISAANTQGLKLDSFRIDREIDYCIVIVEGDDVIGVVCKHK